MEVPSGKSSCEGMEVPSGKSSCEETGVPSGKSSCEGIEVRSCDRGVLSWEEMGVLSCSGIGVRSCGGRKENKQNIKSRRIFIGKLSAGFIIYENSK
jgi:hypothetical protein